jgi:hypothetical protein
LKRFLLVLAPCMLLSACGEPKPDVTVDAGDPLAATPDAAASEVGTANAGDATGPAQAPSAAAP